MSDQNEDFDFALAETQQDPFADDPFESPPSSPMAHWDESYKAGSGLDVNLRSDRPPIFPNSCITLLINRSPTVNYMEIVVTNPANHNTNSLTPDELETVRLFLNRLREEATKSINSDKSETIHQGLLYIIQGLQVRMNQHWHATNSTNTLSVDGLLSLLMIGDESDEEDGLEELMQSLTVGDQPGGEDMQVAVSNGGDDGGRMLPGQDMQQLREDRGVGVFNQLPSPAINGPENTGCASNNEPVMLENGNVVESDESMITHTGYNDIVDMDEIV